MYDKQGNITREGAEKVIREGGSVAIKGKLYSSIDKLPNEADFAAGDPASEANARVKLEKTIADAQAQLKKLGPAGSVVEVGATAGKGAPKGNAGKESDGKS
jgi:hypothetical protein